MQRYLFPSLSKSPFFWLAVVEAVALTASVYAATYLRFGDVTQLEEYLGVGLTSALEFSVAIEICLIAVGLYHRRQRASIAGVVARLIVAFMGGGLILTSTFYLLPRTHLLRGILALAAVLGFASVCLIRMVFVKIVDEGVFRRRVLFLGAGRQAARLQRLRRRTDQRGFRLIGCIRTNEERVLVDAAKIVEKVPEQSLLDFAKTNGVDEIVIAMDERRSGLPLDQLLVCRLNGISVVDLVDFLERETGKLDVELVNPSYMILGPGFRRSAVRALSARAHDIVGSLVLLLLCAPVMTIAALAIFLEDGRPILYRQKRVGLHGQSFNVLKFRSMRVHAEEPGKAQWARRNDVRVTRVGRVLRKYRVDELPQLFNVLRGHMSIVGPRPERPEFVDELVQTIPYYRGRLSVKPGLTGWAQLCYPYGASERDAVEKLQYDLYYVKNHNLLFDLSILLQTAEVVLWQKGAR